MGEPIFRDFVRTEPLLDSLVRGSLIWRWKDELFNFRRAFPSQPCYECLFGQGPSWRSMPRDLGIERDFLVDIGLVGFCKAFCDCVILATTVSWLGEWGQVCQWNQVSLQINSETCLYSLKYLRNCLLLKPKCLKCAVMGSIFLLPLKLSPCLSFSQNNQMELVHSAW